VTASADVPLSVEQLAAELTAAKLRIAELTEELDATNRGIIALHTDLEVARAAEARAVADQEVAAERDRIAVELREQVIQKIFAAGMSLEGSLGLVQNRTAAGRVRAVVTELDAVVTQLRAAVFGTEERRQQAPSLGLQLNNLITEAHHNLGCSPSLGLRGAIDRTVSDELATALLAAVEIVFAAVALSVTRVDVHVEADTELTLSVDYDGPELAVEELAELTANAQSHGGSADIETNESGTRVLWRVPLSEPQA
jgi:signal transduction histidine kinase